MFTRLFIMCALLTMAGCTSIRTTSPTRSAQEVLLISTAADRAADALAAQVPANLTAFVDPSGFVAQDQAYGMAAINDALLRRGVHLVTDRTKADAIIAPRAGVLSTDEKQTLLGVPPLPAPMAGGLVTMPSLSLYQHDEENGIAKFAASVYDPSTGKLIVSTNPAYGFSHASDGVVLFLITWRRNDTDIDLDKRRPKSADGEQTSH
jgi:hypothetical protein